MPTLTSPRFASSARSKQDGCGVLGSSVPWGWLFQERGWDGESSPHVLCSLTCCSRHGLLASNLPATSPRQRLRFPGPLEAGLHVLPSPCCQHKGPVPLCCFRAVSPVRPWLWFETSPFVALVLSLGHLHPHPSFWTPAAAVFGAPPEQGSMPKCTTCCRINTSFCFEHPESEG